VRKRAIFFGIILLSIVICSGCGRDRAFQGQRAYRHVEALLKLGPRPVGSVGNEKARAYIARTLKREGWTLFEDEFAYRGEKVRNLVAKKGSGPVVIIGTHYDTRPLADRDPLNRAQPVPGANDGASGVGVLLELARVLDRTCTDHYEVWLAFFDAEDRGDIDGWEWCVGSRHLAAKLVDEEGMHPEFVVVVDMVGDAHQEIYYEWSSTVWLSEKLWTIAEEEGYREYFIPQYRHFVVDDHSPFLEKGVPAALIIDLDYPYWHTGADTLDKISADSLHRVGDVLETLLEGELVAR